MSNIKVSLRSLELEHIQTLFNKHNSLSAILRELGLSDTCPHSRKILKERMAEISLDQYHKNIEDKHPFDTSEKRMLSNEEFFIKGGYRRRGKLLKNRMLKMGVEDVCNICGQGNIHNELPLVIQVDHINGDSTDNRLENLQLVCPNCHSQTPTFAGRNRVKMVGRP